MVDCEDTGPSAFALRLSNMKFNSSLTLHPVFAITCSGRRRGVPGEIASLIVDLEGFDIVLQAFQILVADGHVRSN